MAPLQIWANPSQIWMFQVVQNIITVSLLSLGHRSLRIIRELACVLSLHCIHTGDSILFSSATSFERLGDIMDFQR